MIKVLFDTYLASFFLNSAALLAYVPLCIALMAFLLHMLYAWPLGMSIRTATALTLAAWLVLVVVGVAVLALALNFHYEFDHERFKQRVYVAAALLTLAVQYIGAYGMLARGAPAWFASIPPVVQGATPVAAAILWFFVYLVMK